MCDIIEYCKFNTEYSKNITSVISAVLMQTNSINFMYSNLRKLLSNRNLKINVEDLILNINEVCSWTKEIMEKKDKEDRLMPILIDLLEIIIKNIDYTSKEQKNFLTKILSSYAFSHEISSIKIPNNEHCISFLKEVILSMDNINNNIIASLSKHLLNKIPIS